MSSSSSVVEFAVYHEKMSALVARLRGLRQWTQTECALRGGISRADVQVIEDLRPTTIAHWDRRIVALERAFDLPLREIVDEQMRPASASPPPLSFFPRVLPFVTATQSIHQNSFEWTGDGVMLDVADHAPQFALLPASVIRRFLGKKIPQLFLQTLANRTKKQVEAAVKKPHTIWGHYQRLIRAAKRDEYAAPLRYQSKQKDGQTFLREVTCQKLTSTRFETRTHIISHTKNLDLFCCGEYTDCANCLGGDAARFFDAYLKKTS